jgi:hypothetical protein
MSLALHGPWQLATRDHAHRVATEPGCYRRNMRYRGLGACELILALSLVGCGGKSTSVVGTLPPGAEEGSGSGSGGSMSASSGGSGSGSSGIGSSSGGLDDTSGGSSGGVAGSSGGFICTPLPGCASSVDCQAPDGCGVCHCGTAGEWVCRSMGCADDLSDAYPVDDASPFANCPDGPPPPGSACNAYPAHCVWGVPDLCGNETCECTTSGIWACAYNACDDEPPFDAGPPCPVDQPNGNSACPALGMVCQYSIGCEANCLCASSGWVCATVQGCVSQDL